MKLTELLDFTQEKIASKFALSTHDAEDVLTFVKGKRKWEDLSDEAREKLTSHYQKTMPYGGNKKESLHVEVFVATSLKKDLGIK